MKNKNVIIYGSIAVTLIIALAVGFTYAFFANGISGGKEIDVTTNISDAAKVVYNMGSNINLTNAEPSDSATTTSSIVLTASNTSDETMNYNVLWVISENNFVYEAEHSTDAQLIYKLESSYDNVNWTTVKNDVDCTTLSGSNVIASSQTLTATKNTSKTIYWRFTIKYPSYNYNQNSNMAKSIAGHIEFVEL